MTYNPDNRPSAEEALKHPWIVENDKSTNEDSNAQSVKVSDVPKEPKVEKETEALFNNNDIVKEEDGSQAKFEVKFAGDSEDGGKLDLYKSFERTLPFADM